MTKLKCKCGRESGGYLPVSDWGLLITDKNGQKVHRWLCPCCLGMADVVGRRACQVTKAERLALGVIKPEEMGV